MNWFQFRFLDHYPEQQFFTEYLLLNKNDLHKNYRELWTSYNLRTLITITSLFRFSPPLTQFTDKISPLCLPQLGDEAKLPIGTNCYARGICSCQVTPTTDVVTKYEQTPFFFCYFSSFWSCLFAWNETFSFELWAGPKKLIKIQYVPSQWKLWLNSEIIQCIFWSRLGIRFRLTWLVSSASGISEPEYM